MSLDNSHFKSVISSPLLDFHSDIQLSHDINYKAATHAWNQVESLVLSKSLLSDKGILYHITKGTVIIEPFSLSNLSTSSYDVTLGRYYYRESQPEPGQGIYNPYSAKMVKKVWGDPQEAECAKEWMNRNDQILENINRNDRIIWIQPGETILGHTNEFIGGRKTVTSMMKARSSMGRNFIEACKCADKWIYKHLL